MIAIEICRHSTKYGGGGMIPEHLVLFESSQKIFHLGVYANSKQFNIHVSNDNIFKDPKIYCGSLSIYLSSMLGCNQTKRIELYEYLKRKSPCSLDDSLQLAFDYVKENSLYPFENERELDKMKAYVRYLMVKSNVGVMHSYDNTFKLDIPVCLIRSANFIYKKHFDDVYYRDMHDENLLHKFEINMHDFSLSEIMAREKDLQIMECSRGNHWTFINENLEEISSFLAKLLTSTKSKL